MNYEIVTLKERRVVGLGTRTGNEQPDAAEKIGQVWNDLYCGGGCEKLKDVVGETSYGLYCNYSGDGSSYDMLAAVETAAPAPEGFREVVIPGGKYAKFSFQGDVQKDVVRFWGEIWNTQLARAYTVDFEEYPPCEDMANAQINIYVALGDRCQSCGMPMTKDEEYGTEADGSKSSEYCCYCYEKGAFKSDCTMEQMIDLCLDMSADSHMYDDRAKAKGQMMEYFATLKRWKQ